MRRALLATVVAATALMASQASSEGDIRVIDGDTLAIGDERIRIMGLDAPEMRGKCGDEIRLAKRAKRRLRELLSGSSVLIIRDGRDRYGRTLATTTADGVDVAGILIREGLARDYHGGRRAGWCG